MSPGPGRGDLDRVVVLWLIHDRSTVTSPKVVLKVNGRFPGMDTAPALPRRFCGPLLVGLLDEASESRRRSEGRPDRRTPRSGRGGARPGTARAAAFPATAAAEGLIVPVDGAEVDGGLRPSVARIVSLHTGPMGSMVHLFYRSGRESRSPEQNRSGNQPPSSASCLSSPDSRAIRIFVGARQFVRGHRPAGAAPSGTRGRHTPILAHQLASARKSSLQ